MRSALPIAFAILALCGCFAARTSTDKLLDAAYDHNVAMRFGRMDVALEHVSTSTREEWLRRRAEWSGHVRIVDIELYGMQIVNKDEARVRVRVAWQRLDEAELRATDLTQKWRSDSGPWQLAAEECAGGDDTLLAATKEAIDAKSVGGKNGAKRSGSKKRKL